MIMTLVPLSELLQDAWAGKYAVCAINCCNLENVKSVLDAAAEAGSPIIIQAAPSEARHGTVQGLAAAVRAVGRDLRVRAAIHLDHGDSYELAAQCIRGGFTGVMFDGSALGFAENILATRKVAELGRCSGVSVEGELGTIGKTTELGELIEHDYMTDPLKAEEFVASTGIDCLAVAIGNAHGFYPFPPKLDFARLEAIARLVKIPLVLHGGTGIPDEQITRAISLGIAKINFSTVTKKAFIDAVKAYLVANPDAVSVTKLMKAGSAAFKETVKTAIVQCGSGGRL
jgi:ketose-bisphosphate aldolase